MFTIDDFMCRHRDSLSKQFNHWCAPKNGFDDIPVRVSHNEFHDLCTQNPEIYTSMRVHGLPVIVTEQT